MLNSSQQQAIDFDGGHLLIVAGPGTGKTHTLTHRIARKNSQLAADQSALAITFTNKAAVEMQERLAKLEVPQDSLFVGTFHRFCLSILRRHYESLNISADFEVADPKRIRERVSSHWPELTTRKCNTRLAQISQWKSVDAIHSDPLEEVIDYDRVLKKEGWLDYDDLLLLTWQLWDQNPDILCDYQKKFLQIYVDEYQDINPIQHELLLCLTGKENEVTAIGDPNQAIYSFRGADVGYFGQFAEDFEGANQLSLIDNYRSGRDLLSASMQVIEKFNTFQVPALTAQLYLEGRLIIHMCSTVAAEAEYVVHQIEKLIGGASLFSQDSGRVSSTEDHAVSFGDIAILYRLNSQQHALCKALDRMGFPYHVTQKKDPDEEDELCPDRREESQWQAEKISLLTLHASKGLEFPVVFIVGCEERLLPLNLEGYPADPREERRLFYVGMTRAQRHLYLLGCKKRSIFGATHNCKSSRFLADIEDQLKTYDKEFKPVKRKKNEQQMNLFG